MKYSESPIPQYIADKTPRGDIPDYVQKSLTKRDVESVPYKISFVFYRMELCEIKILARAHLRKSLEVLRNAGFCKNRQELLNHNIRLEKVGAEKGYEKYFTKLLTKDVVLYHCNIGEKQRMFYFIDDAEKTFNIVAFRNTHDRTDRSE